MATLKAEDITIEIISDTHKKITTTFKSYEPDLVNFLKDDALHNQNQNISLTFLWFYKNKLISYVTLLTDKISLEGNLKQFFKEKSIPYKSLPALKIGRLCVDDSYLMRGLGRLMVQFAIQKAEDINKEKAGCRFITLDAKRNKDKTLDSIRFYRKLGFKELKTRIKGTTPMYLDLRLP